MRNPARYNLVTLRTGLIALVAAFLAMTALPAKIQIIIQPHREHQDPSPPSASIDPDSLNFGDQVVRRISAAKRVTIKNTGGKPLYFDGVTIGGNNPSEFSIVKDTCTGASIDPNKACIIDVSFSPSKVKERNADLNLADNALDSPQTLKLTGNGINSNDVPPF